MKNCENVKNYGFGFLKKITIEPIIICWLVSYILASTYRSELIEEKVCRELVDSSKGFDRDICKIVIYDIFDYDDCYNIYTYKYDGIEGKENWTEIFDVEIVTIKDRFPYVYESIENDLEDALSHVCEIKEDPILAKRTLDYNARGNLFFEIVPIVILMFVGPWSDQQNLRLPCLLIPLLGQTICHLALLVSTVFIDGPAEFPTIAGKLIPLAGGRGLMIMGIYSYYTVNSTEINRLLSFGGLYVLFGIIHYLIEMLSWYNFNEFSTVFVFTVILQIFGLAYGLFYLKENTENEAQENSKPSLESMKEDFFLQKIEVSIEESKSIFQEIFDLKFVKQCIIFPFKSRSNCGRIVIILIILSFLATKLAFVQDVGGNHFDEYLMSQETNTFLDLKLFNLVMRVIGALVIVGLLSKLLKLSDMLLVNFACALAVALFVSILVFWNEIEDTDCDDYQLCILNRLFLDYPFDWTFVTLFSAATKVIPRHETGTMFAVFGIVEKLALLDFYMNEKSLDNAPSAIMVIAALILCIIAYVILTYQSRKVNHDKTSRASVESTKF